jgi:anthranilate/para-aminobenzoate synthase component I
MHIVSNVQEHLEEEKDTFDVLRATFQRVRCRCRRVQAMEIIDELEPVVVGYTAARPAIFLFGNMDMAITIRFNGRKDGRYPGPARHRSRLGPGRRYRRL